jgi:hypothetical protein
MNESESSTLHLIERLGYAQVVVSLAAVILVTLGAKRKWIPWGWVAGSLTLGFCLGVLAIVFTYSLSPKVSVQGIPFCEAIFVQEGDRGTDYINDLMLIVILGNFLSALGLPSILLAIGAGVSRLFSRLMRSSSPVVNPKGD